MLNRERLLEITELTLAGIQKMDGPALETYVCSLNAFIEALPALDEKMKAALEAKDYSSLAKSFADLRDLLEAIHAGYKADECTKQIKELKNVKHEKLEVFMTYFLTSLSMLSIEIQIAEHTETETAAHEKTTSENKSENKEQKCILAVDDTAFFLNMLKTTLQQSEYKLTCVRSGEDALKFFEKHHADLFLLDIEMPYMDGYELAVNLRKSGQKAPIIFLTGNAKKENVTKALAAGAADFIVKPINKDVLLAKIARYI